VAVLVCWLSNLLNETVALQQLRQSLSMHVVMHVDVYVKVAADNDRALVRREVVEHC